MHFAEVWLSLVMVFSTTGHVRSVSTYVHDDMYALVHAWITHVQAHGHVCVGAHTRSVTAWSRACWTIGPCMRSLDQDGHHQQSRAHLVAGLPASARLLGLVYLALVFL